jgi:hypothetical protein
LKGLQGRILEIFDSIRAQLADLAMSVEAAKALRLQLSVLVQSLAAGTELEPQIHELSRMLGGVFPAKTVKEKRERLKRQNQSRLFNSSDCQYGQTVRGANQKGRTGTSVSFRHL